MKHINCMGLNGDGVTQQLIASCNGKDKIFTLHIQSNFNETGLVIANYLNDYSKKSIRTYNQEFGIPSNQFELIKLIDYLIACIREEYNLTIYIIGPKYSIKQCVFWVSNMPPALQ